MAPPNPKRPNRPRATPPVETPAPRKARTPDKTDADLPFDAADVVHLRADDPRPQRVTQYPSNSRLSTRRSSVKPSAGDFAKGNKDDRELQPRYGHDVSEPGFTSAFVYVERGPGTGQLMPINQGPMILGRSSTADLRLQHPSISRRHAQLTRKGEQFFLRDLQSQNGTFVNKQRISAEVEVSAGDQITLGTAFLRLRGANGGQENGLPLESDTAGSAKTPAVFRPGVAKVAIFACAAFFGITGVLMLALTRLESASSSSSVPMAEVHAPKVAAAPAAKPVPAPAVEKAAAPDPIGNAQPIIGTITTTRHASKRAAAKKAAQKAALVAKAAPVPVEVASATAGSAADEEAVRGRYEQGNVSAAIELAKKAHSPLLAKLTKFKSSYDAATRSLASKDASGAKAALKDALQADESISNGWGSYNAELKRELVALGQQGAAVKPAHAAAKPVKSIDDAFDGEAAPKQPARTAPPAKKKAAASIDEAFDG